MATSLGCNSILGIDAANLDTSEGGTTTTTTTMMPGTCSLKSTDPCNACVAQKCCPEYDACAADPACKKGLIDYAFCLGRNFTSDAGATCDEDFVGTAGTLGVALATCAIVDMNKCGGTCAGQTIGEGDLCTTYCGCMQNVCADHPFDGGTCAEICNSFDPNQLVCRPYHCNLATINMADPGLRTLHCGHASGNSPCH